MAKGKSKSHDKITQLELFQEEQPADHNEVNDQAEISHTAQPADIAIPKKRAGNKKIKAQETRSDIPAPDQSGEPVIQHAPVATEENPILPQPADAEQTDEKEIKQKEKFKKIQEERLAALRKARGVK